MQCQNLYKSSSKQTIQTICILIHMIPFNFVLIIKKSDALHEHILHKIGVLFGLNSNVKIDNIKYINCGGYGTLAAFSIGKLLYCKFNGNDKASEVKQRDIAQLPSEYTLNSSIGTYMNVLVRDHNTGTLQIDADGKITLYCPYQYLYGYVIIPIK